MHSGSVHELSSGRNASIDTAGTFSPPLAPSILQTLQPDGVDRQAASHKELTAEQLVQRFVFVFFFVAKLALAFPKAAEIPVTLYLRRIMVQITVAESQAGFATGDSALPKVASTSHISHN